MIENELSQVSPGFDASGAVPLKVEVRCPECLKLYKIRTEDVHTREPVFECQVCQTHFSIPFPPLGRQLVAKVVKYGNSQIKLNAGQAPREVMNCPKCKTLNLRTHKECVGCGLIIEKHNLIRTEEKQVRTIPSLMKAWQETLSDYGNMAKHWAFVDRCEEFQALPFALKKYRDLKVMQPQDEVANKMFNSLFMKFFSQASLSFGKNQWYENFKEKIPWRNIFKSAPFVISASLILIGTFSLGLRNMVGMGVAILFLTLGIIWFNQGSLNLKEYWKE